MISFIAKMPAKRFKQCSLSIRQELSALETEEEKYLAETQAAEQEAAEVEMHSVAFVERLNGSQLFHAMFENDADGQALVKISEETKEFYETYPVSSKKKFVDYSNLIIIIFVSMYHLVCTLITDKIL